MIALSLLIACDPSPSDTSVVVIDSVPVDEEDSDTGVLGEEVPPRVPDVVVDCNGGADFLTIHDAIEASRSGTKIGLAPCTYVGDIDYNGKSLDIFGIEGSAVTTIQGSGYGAVVMAKHGESVGTRLAGVTITGGATEGYYGSGLGVDMALMQLEDVVFTGNDVGFSVVHANAAFLEFTDVSFVDNRVEPTGGITVMTNGSAVVQRMTVRCTDADYSMYMHNASLVLDSDLDCGRIYGIYNQGNGVHVRRSRIRSDGYGVFSKDRDDTRNERSYFFNSAILGGDTAIYSEYMNVRAENNVVIGDRIGFDLRYSNLESFVTNNYAAGSECGIQTTTEAYEIGWNAVAPGNGCNVGHDSISGDPGFVSAPDDFTLLPTSPLVDAGDPDPKREDPDGTRNDIGMFGGREGDGQR